MLYSGGKEASVLGTSQAGIDVSNCILKKPLPKTGKLKTREGKDIKLKFTCNDYMFQNALHSI